MPSAASAILGGYFIKIFTGNYQIGITQQPTHAEGFTWALVRERPEIIIPSQGENQNANFFKFVFFILKLLSDFLSFLLSLNMNNPCEQ